MRQRLMARSILVAAVGLVGCGGEEEQAIRTSQTGPTQPLFTGMPTFATAPVGSNLGPTPMPTVSPAPAGTPTPTPSPAQAVPTPTATPNPGQPAPTPTPTATPAPSGTCNLTAMPDGSSCAEESPHFNPDVEAAVRQIRRDRPNLFLSDGKKVKPQFYDEYVKGVAEILRSYGYCSEQGGPEDEVAVKKNNNWNDQYDVLMGDGTSWVAYTVTCRPSRF